MPRYEPRYAAAAVAAGDGGRTERTASCRASAVALPSRDRHAADTPPEPTTKRRGEQSDAEPDTPRQLLNPHHAATTLGGVS